MHGRPRSNGIVAVVIVVFVVVAVVVVVVVVVVVAAAVVAVVVPAVAVAEAVTIAVSVAAAAATVVAAAVIVTVVHVQDAGDNRDNALCCRSVAKNSTCKETIRSPKQGMLCRGSASSRSEAMGCN